MCRELLGCRHSGVKREESPDPSWLTGCHHHCPLRLPPAQALVTTVPPSLPYDLLCSPTCAQAYVSASGLFHIKAPECRG